MSNTITAYFKGRVGVAESVYQNDYGIVMAFDSIDLPAHFDCYFSRLNQEEALPGIGADRMVVIPNSILASPGTVTIHIPIHTGENDSEVEYVVYFKVIGRARPIDDGTPTQMTAIEQALALLQNPITNIEQIVNEALAFTGETFDEMQEDLDEWKGGVEHDFDVLDAQYQTAVAALTVDSEVQGIRVGDDGVTYTSAGEAVRTQFSNVKDDLQGYVNGTIDYNNVSVIKEKAVKTSDGTIASFSGYTTWAVTNRYPIPEGTYKIRTNFVSGSSSYGYALYDASGTYVTGGQAMTDITIEPTHKYIRLTSYDSTSAHAGLYIKFDVNASIDSLDKSLGWTQDDVELLLPHLVPTSTEANKYATMSGGTVGKYTVSGSSLKTYDVSSLVGETLYFSAVRNASPNTAYVMIADENNGYLASVDDADHDSIVNGAVTIPAGAKYLYLNYLTSSKRGQVMIDYNAKNTLSNFAEAFLWSASPIYWDWSAGKIESESAISIFIPSEQYSAVLANVVNGLATVSCGTSRFLYYNKATNGLTSVGTIYTNSRTLLLIGMCQAHQIDYLTLQKGCGKKCVCYGDSITWYDGNAYNWGKFNGDTAVGFETWLKREFGFAIYNYGASGETSLQICNRVRSADLSSFDYLILTSGANDERHNVPLGNVREAGTTFDTTTFCGAFQSAIESALSDNDELKIVLCTPIQGWIYENGYDAGDYPDHPDGGYINPKWANAIKRIAEIYALPVCDWYGESGINLSTRNVYINDPEPTDGNTLYSLHPTPKGYKRMSEILISTFKQVMPI